jgi:hypothetical protein
VGGVAGALLTWGAALVVRAPAMLLALAALTLASLAALEVLWWGGAGTRTLARRTAPDGNRHRRAQEMCGKGRDDESIQQTLHRRHNSKP